MRQALIASLLAAAAIGSLAPACARAVPLATTQVGHVCQTLGASDDYVYGAALPVAQDSACDQTSSGTWTGVPYVAHAEGTSGAGFGAIPQVGVTTATTFASSDNGTASSYLYANVTFSFQVQLIGGQPNPGLAYIPVSTSAQGTGYAERTGYGYAESKGIVQVNGSNLGFEQVYFEYDAYVVDEIAFDPVDSENQTAMLDGTKSANLRIGDIYTVDISSSCESWVAPIGGQSAGASAGCTGWVDPSFTFDQAAFDQQMGTNTYRLDDYYQIVFSPNVPVPEADTYALMLAGLGLVGWVARRRNRI